MSAVTHYVHWRALYYLIVTAGSGPPIAAPILADSFARQTLVVSR